MTTPRSPRTEADPVPFTRSQLAKALDDHLPRMAFREYGEFYNDDPDFDIEAYYERVADAILVEAEATAPALADSFRHDDSDMGTFHNADHRHHWVFSAENFWSEHGGDYCLVWCEVCNKGLTGGDHTPFPLDIARSLADFHVAPSEEFKP